MWQIDLENSVAYYDELVAGKCFYIIDQGKKIEYVIEVFDYS